MLVRVLGAKCIGIDAVVVTVEVEIDRGIGIHLCGLADVAVKESLLRTTTALQALGYRIPGKKIVINLAPADLRKNGSGYDLPIAVGIIAASGQVLMPELGQYVIMGELGLDGSVRPIPAALPFAELAGKEGCRGVILPLESALEAADFEDTQVYGVRNLPDVIRILGNSDNCSDLLVRSSREYAHIKTSSSTSNGRSGCTVDFADIIGQEEAKRAVEIAAAGGHNIIMIGSPGSGKSSLAKAMAGILPPMTKEESIVTSKIYSIAGKGPLHAGLIRQRPFRSPHYSASVAAVIGGGCGDNVIPGEVSLAQNGVLFLDEAGQLSHSVIEALRGPLEDRTVTVSRLKAKIEYPASFMLVAASNPCPCGYWGVGDRCTCTPSRRNAYLSRLSGPVMDRIDLQCLVSPVAGESIRNAVKAESSRDIAVRVARARSVQNQRFAGAGISCNAEMSNKDIEKYCELSVECRDTMDRLLSRMQFSMRAYFRIIKVARTIADLEGEDKIQPRHLIEAAGYRFLDRQVSEW